MGVYLRKVKRQGVGIGIGIGGKVHLRLCISLNHESDCHGPAARN